MTSDEVAKEASSIARRRVTDAKVRSWIAAGHLQANAVQAVDGSGRPVGKPTYDIPRAAWEEARERCLSLPLGRKAAPPRTGFGVITPAGVSPEMANFWRKWAEKRLGLGGAFYLCLRCMHRVAFPVVKAGDADGEFIELCPCGERLSKSTDNFSRTVRKRCQAIGLLP